MESVTDKISEKLSPVLRKLQDVNIKLLGTSVELLRIVVGEADIFGDTPEEELETYIVGNAIVKHPWSNALQIFGTQEITGETTTSATDLWDVLPIEVRIPFKGNKDDDLIDLKINDLLVEVLFDENNKKIPLILQVTKTVGAFNITKMVGKKFECALYRGKLPLKVQRAIDNYVVNKNK